jgi:predicted anti-sigma-YlaC factor YlaD
MSVVRVSDVCDGARSQLSRRLDGELSQLEEHMLASHLERCSECGAFAVDVASFTTDIRTAPLEQLTYPIVVRRSPRPVLARVQVGVAAAVAVAVIGSVLHIAIPASRSAGASTQTITKFQTSDQVAREVRQIIADGKAFKLHRGGSSWAT